MKSLLLIFLGGGTGSVLRYLLTISIYRRGTTNFPWGTFIVNIFGLHTDRGILYPHLTHSYQQ